MAEARVGGGEGDSCDEREEENREKLVDERTIASAQLIYALTQT
jgi:hypothetical protein